MPGSDASQSGWQPDGSGLLSSEALSTKKETPTMNFHSFEQLRKRHHIPSSSPVGRFLFSVAIAMTLFSGLLMLMPLAT